MGKKFRKHLQVEAAALPKEEPNRYFCLWFALGVLCFMAFLAIVLTALL